MFSYFGSKSKLVKHYPKPLYGTIIEPFAGSARYALMYWEKKIILIEKNKTIFDIWNWLVNEATKNFILSLPLFEHKEKIVYKDSIIRNLIALESNEGTAKPRNYSRWRSWEPGRKRIADNLYKIKHWKIIHGDYSLAPNIEAS